MENNDWKEYLQYEDVLEKIEKVHKELEESLKGAPDGVLDNIKSAITEIENKLKYTLKYTPYDGRRTLCEYVSDLYEKYYNVETIRYLYNRYNRYNKTRYNKTSNDSASKVSNVMDLIREKQMVNYMLEGAKEYDIRPIAEGMDKDILEYGKVNPEFLKKYEKLEELHEVQKKINKAKNIERRQKALVNEAEEIECMEERIKKDQKELNNKKILLGMDYNRKYQLGILNNSYYNNI